MTQCFDKSGPPRPSEEAKPFDDICDQSRRGERLGNSLCGGPTARVVVGVAVVGCGDCSGACATAVVAA